MKENFCDYETSKMLKELGYQQEESFMDWIKYKNFNEAPDLSNDYIDSQVESISAPLWQEAKQWLWGKHKMWIKIEDGYSAELWIEKAMNEYMLDVSGNTPIQA